EPRPALADRRQLCGGVAAGRRTPCAHGPAGSDGPLHAPDPAAPGAGATPPTDAGPDPRAGPAPPAAASPPAPPPPPPPPPDPPHGVGSYGIEVPAEGVTVLGCDAPRRAPGRPGKPTSTAAASSAAAPTQGTTDRLHRDSGRQAGHLRHRPVRQPGDPPDQ